jgi:hypothetical protein
MTSYRNKSVCVVDTGVFCEFANTLAKSFGKVYYFSPWVNGYPKSNGLLVGHMPNVTRVDNMWSLVDEVDLWFFPDVYFGPEQMQLVKLGKRVWGSRMGDELELDREASKEHLKKLGIDVGPYKVVKGLDALRDHLKENDGQYVKISKTRGDMETFRAKNYKLIEPRLDELEHTLGAKKRIMEFIVEEEIPDAVEIAFDGWTIDGQFPKTTLYGIEIKDKGYIGRTRRYADLPEPVREVNAKLARTLRAYEYRNFWAAEMRLTKDGKAYVIDPCCRGGSPPSELYQAMITNLADVVWEGAEGNMVEPEYAGRWGAELLLISTWADKNWQAVEFPRSIRDHVKLRNLCVIDGKHYVAPQWTGCPEIGAVVAWGDTMKEAAAECQRLAEKVEGHYVEVPTSALDEAAAEIAKLDEYGISF